MSVTATTERRGPRVLYVSYDGALDPLGRSQVVPYLERLAGHGVDVSLLSFEKPEALADAARVAAVDAGLARAGVRWHRLRYHKRPALLVTAWDVLAGVARAVALARRSGATIIHARSYIAALIGLLAKRVTGAALVFDMRGLWVDERADAGFWRRSSWPYRAAKRMERRLFLGADGLVSLTHNGLAAVGDLPYIKGWSRPAAVIPTCVDLDLFQPDTEAKRRAGLEGRLVVGYLGSLGTWYLFDEMTDFFLTVKRERPDAVFSLITNGDAAWARARLHARGLGAGDYRVASLPREEIPAAVATFDVSLAFYRAGWSRRATCPTKLGESLACGVPVVATAGVGDVAEIVTKHRVGVVLPAPTPAAYAEAWRELHDLRAEGPELRARCRAAAEEHFSLDRGVERYLELYAEVGPRGRHS